LKKENNNLKISIRDKYQKTAELESYKAKISQFLVANNNFSNANTVLRLTSKASEDKLAEIRNLNDVLGTELRLAKTAFNQDIFNANEKLEKVQKALDEKKAELDGQKLKNSLSLKAKLEQKGAEVDQTCQKLVRANENLEKLQKAFNEKTTQIKSMTLEVAKLQKGQTDTTNETSQQIKMKEEDIHQLNVTIEKLTTDLKKAEARHFVIEDNKCKCEATKAISEQLQKEVDTFKGLLEIRDQEVQLRCQEVQLRVSEIHLLKNNTYKSS
jgi:chromosome segregation ATPase